MAVAWSKTEFAQGWRGLFLRHADVDVPAMFASIARNVDLYGGAPGKRLGTQYVTGWGTIATSDWSHVGGFIFTGDVLDTAGLAAGQAVVLVRQGGPSEGEDIGILTGIVGSTLTVDFTAGTSRPLLGDALISRKPLNDGARVDGLFQAIFRSGLRVLLAAAGDALFRVNQSPGTSQKLTEALPETTIRSTWADTTTGSLATVETIRADPTYGEHIRIQGAGPGGEFYEGRVVAVDWLNESITVSPPTTTPPVAGRQVILFPARKPGDTHFLQYANLTHVVSDTTPPVKITPGLVVQRHGILPRIIELFPDALPGASGVLAGDYSYRVKFRNSATGQESEPNPTMPAPLTLASQSVRITVRGSPDPQVDQIRIYRTTSGGNGTWYYLATIPNTPGGTSSYTDNLPDEALGFLMREFLDNVLPDGVGDMRMVTVIALWSQANRLVGLESTIGEVLFSDQPDLTEGFFKPEAWPVDNELLINFDDGDKPRGAASFFDSLLIGKRRSIHRVQGLPPNISIEPVIFRADLTAIGFFNQKALVVDQDTLLFPSEDGFYSINRYQGVQQGFQSSRISREIDDEWQRLTLTRRQAAHAIYFRTTRQLRAWLSMDGNVEPSQGLIYQFDGGIDGSPYGWTEWDVPRLPVPGRFPTLGSALGYTASCVAAGLTDVQDIVYVGTASGDILRMDIGLAEAGGLVYTFDYRTVWWCPVGKGIPARGRALDLVVSPRTPALIRLATRTEFQDGGFVDVPITPAGAGFVLDVSRLDIDRLGENVVRQRQRAILLALGEYHQLRFTETSNRTGYRFQAWTYWHQGLPTEALPATAVQTAIVRA